MLGPRFPCLSQRQSEPSCPPHSWYRGLHRMWKKNLGSYLQGGRTTSPAALAGHQQWALRWAELRGSSGHEVQGRGQRHKRNGTSKSLPRIVEPRDKSTSRESGPSGYRLGPPCLKQPFWGITTAGISQGTGTPRESQGKRGGRGSGFGVSQIWAPV